MSARPVLELVRTRAAIAGVVVDGATGRPLARARVEIRDRPDAAVVRGAVAETTPDGRFAFLNLPRGTYRLHVSAPGAGTRYGDVETAVKIRASRGSTGPASTRIELPATGVRGTVKDAEGAPVRRAAVRVVGTGETAVSDEKGRFVLAGVETGARSLRVAAPRFDRASVAVALETPGSMATVDVSLQPSSP